ncbi:odorant-binding protein-like isoform X2 [Ovis aries]|uniref:odorant-binding protein-like isoform X2 n=1 Tax=Ovis aries TaxID=9940 RepID=UPI001C2DF2E6|nr:odorant-binding protein-like isoform X2 [Ovis aries]
MSHQHKDPIKSGTIPILSNHWDTLRLDRRRTTRDKMKVLFLTLLLGVVCAAQEKEVEQNPSELSGQWRTVYIGSTDPEKIQEDGPFRTYFHKIVFDDEKGTVDFYFYVKQNGKWKNVHVTGTKQDDGTYSVEYEGQNEFKVLSVSKTHLVAHNFNVDKQGKETELTGLFVKFNVEDEDEDLEKFRTEDQGSDRKYVVTFAENGCRNLPAENKNPRGNSPTHSITSSSTGGSANIKHEDQDTAEVTHQGMKTAYEKNTG